MSAFSVLARSSRYGRSKLAMLYPMTTSGSTSSTNFCQALNSLISSSKLRTCEPTMWEQVLRVKTFRMKGLLSPEEYERLSKEATGEGQRCTDLGGLPYWRSG